MSKFVFIREIRGCFFFFFKRECFGFISICQNIPINQSVFLFICFFIYLCLNKILEFLPNYIPLQMRILFFLYLLVLPTLLFSQEKKTNEIDFNSKYNSSDSIRKPKAKIATIDMYRIITLERDTT